MSVEGKIMEKMELFDDKTLPANVGDVLEMKFMDATGKNVKGVEQRTISKISPFDKDLYAI